MLPNVAVQGWRHQGRVGSIGVALVDRGGAAGGGDCSRSIHDVPFPLLWCVVKTSWSKGSLGHGVRAFSQDTSAKCLLLLLGSLQQLEVDAVSLEMVSIIRMLVTIVLVMVVQILP